MIPSHWCNATYSHSGSPAFRLLNADASKSLPRGVDGIGYAAFSQIEGDRFLQVAIDDQFVTFVIDVIRQDIDGARWKELFKEASEAEKTRINTELSTLNSEQSTMEELLRQAEIDAVDLVAAWEQGKRESPPGACQGLFPRRICLTEIKTALSNGEVSIHWAWKLRETSAEDQRDALGRFRFEKGLLKDVRKLAARRQRECLAAPQDANDLLNGLVQLAAEKLHSFRVEVIKGTRPEIFITEELARMIGMEQRRLWNQSVVCKNSPKAPESCGPDTESVRRYATI